MSGGWGAPKCKTKGEWMGATEEYGVPTEDCSGHLHWAGGRRDAVLGVQPKAWGGKKPVEPKAFPRRSQYPKSPPCSPCQPPMLLSAPGRDSRSIWLASEGLRTPRTATCASRGSGVVRGAQVQQAQPSAPLAAGQFPCGSAVSSPLPHIPKRSEPDVPPPGRVHPAPVWWYQPLSRKVCVEVRGFKEGDRSLPWVPVWP